MSVTNFITIAVRGSKSDITDLHKRLVAFENEGTVTMDYRTMALVRMLDDSADVSFYGIELKSPTLVEFETYWEKRPSLGKILQQLKSAYEDTKVFFYFTIDQDVAPSPIVYDPEHEIFDFDEPAFYLDKDFDPEEDELPWDEYDEWMENLSEEEEDEDCREHISSREEMVGIPVAQIREYTYGFEITDEEAKKLKDNDSVKIYVRGPYFASNEAIVEDKISVFDRNLPLGLTFYELQSALEEKWEEKDYGHNFEDFVIEGFEMKITKGNVKIYIELGS